MSETLHTCPECGQANFTTKGLKAHQGGKTCKARAASLHSSPSGNNRQQLSTTVNAKPQPLTVPASEDALMGQQLTTQYHRATGGMKEVVIFGAMMMQLREKYPELAQKGGDRRSNSTRGVCSAEPQPVSLKKWLATHAPDIKEASAYRFLHVTESIAEKYKEIVGAKVAKAIPLPQLVTSAAEDLPDAACKAKQLELFDYVNGTSQKSWLDMFSPDSPQKRGSKTRKTEKIRPPTEAELRILAKEELTTLLNAVDAFFRAGHQNRVDAELLTTADAVFELARKFIKAVK